MSLDGTAGWQHLYYFRRKSGNDLAVDGGAGGLRLACSCHLSPARAGQLAFKEASKLKWCIRQDVNLLPSDVN